MLCSIGLQPFSRSEEIQGVGTEILPKYAQELGIIAEMNASRAYGYDECQCKAYQEIEKADAEDADHNDGHITERYMIPADSIQPDGSIRCGDGDMPDVEPDAEEVAKGSGKAQEETEYDVARQATCMAVEIVCNALQTVAGYVLTQERMFFYTTTDTAIVHFILHIPGNETAEEQKHAGIAGI